MPTKRVVFEVGKTTTAVNLGAGLARRGYKVLLVDLDAQGNCAIYLGASYTFTLYHVLVEHAPPEDCIVPSRDNLDLLAADKQLASAKEILTGRRFREETLTRTMQGPVEDYDFIFLDCAPSLDILNVNALIYAPEVLIPVSVDYLATVGARAHLESVEEIREAGYDTQVSMILPTFFDARTRKSQEVVDILTKHFGRAVADPIRINVRLAEAPGYHQTIWEYDPKSRGAEDYEKLVGRYDNHER